MSLDLREKGRPSVNISTCIGCGHCIAVCPDEVLLLKNGKAAPGEGVFLGCIACGHCVAACPTKSIAVRGRGMRPDDAIEFSASPRATAEQLDALLLGRRSIRNFQKQEIDRALIERILAMTATAPMGIPPSDVGVVVFHGFDKVQQFAADASVAFERAARFFNPLMLGLMRPLMGREGYLVMRDFVKPLLKMLAEKRKVGEDWFTYNAPAALLFHYGPMSGEADCHIAATYAMLAAESLGLGSCMLGTTAALNQAKDFKAKYEVPAKNKFGLAVVLGYATREYHRGVKRRLAAVKFA